MGIYTKALEHNIPYVASAKTLSLPHIPAQVHTTFATHIHRLTASNYTVPSSNEDGSTQWRRQDFKEPGAQHASVHLNKIKERSQKFLHIINYTYTSCRGGAGVRTRVP